MAVASSVSVTHETTAVRASSNTDRRSEIRYRRCPLATCHGYYTPNTKRVGLTKARITQEILLIGVISKTNEEEAVQEFFELFKTPWEFYKENKTYDVVLITCDPAIRDRGEASYHVWQ